MQRVWTVFTKYQHNKLFFDDMTYTFGKYNDKVK